MSHAQPESATAAAEAYTRGWLKDGEISFVTLANGTRVRYVKAGQGPNLVLTHTVRTQLDLFQFVIPNLARRFTVYALDLPGFGWSDIDPSSAQDEPTLRAHLKAFLSALRIERPILVGESVGATLSLTVAADPAVDVSRVVAVNTYDYLPGLERSNALASIIIKSVRAPIVGPIFAALENRSITGGVMAGGFYDPKALPGHLLDEYARVGKRPGYAKASRNLVRALPSFVAARSLYPAVRAPTTLVWGDKDWSNAVDRAGVESCLPSPRVVTINRAGHFISVERPDDFVGAVIQAAA